jgi:hypothetical protein
MKARNVAKLKLSAIPDEKPVKITVELPAATHHDLLAYAEAIAHETGQTISDPARLIAPMLQRFMSTDRAFIRLRRSASPPSYENQTTHLQADQPDKSF